MRRAVRSSFVVYTAASVSLKTGTVMATMTAVQEIFQMNLTAHLPLARIHSSAVVMVNALQAAGDAMALTIVAMVRTS